ncbi:MAG: copper ion binding protein [Desulfobacula sp.]|uniref:copper ion binding protein n=1 Tax=Desulfobacula sp. TaxID=2593537 RepID=UPI001DF869FA|nr:copper ion binding protein [Desulfobacula sp.]
MTIQTKTVLVSDMTCASCSARVEKAAQKTTGVEKASVNLTTEKLTVSFDDSISSLDIISENILKAGYGVKIPDAFKIVEYFVTGMTCASCVSRVEKAIDNIDYYEYY